MSQPVYLLEKEGHLLWSAVGLKPMFVHISYNILSGEKYNKLGKIEGQLCNHFKPTIFDVCANQMTHCLIGEIIISSTTKGKKFCNVSNTKIGQYIGLAIVCFS